MVLTEALYGIVSRILFGIELGTHSSNVSGTVSSIVRDCV